MMTWYANWILLFDCDMNYWWLLMNLNDNIYDVLWNMIWMIE